ncbi:mechanosensitive ion channel, partial [Psychrobacter sp. SIMBA_152]
MIRIVVLVIALVLIIPRIIEPTLQNMVATLGAAGLAIGFALKDYVSSLIAGVVAIHEMPYRPGDWIEVDGSYGEVTHIGMRTVELVTNDDTVIWVPHLKLW